jgi:hypothetical protein
LFGGGPVAGTAPPPPPTTPPAPAPGGGRGPSGAELQIPLVDTEGNGLPQFSNPVHAIKISNDGLVYVADRVGRRVQVFTTDGKYVTQGFVNRAGPSRESAAGLAFSPDAQQRFLYVGDFGNSRIVVMNRKTLEVLYQFGARNASPGNFQGVHHIAADSKGNLYTAEVNPGNRAQRFIFKGLSATPPPNALPTRSGVTRGVVRHRVRWDRPRARHARGPWLDARAPVPVRQPSRASLGLADVARSAGPTRQARPLAAQRMTAPTRHLRGHQSVRSTTVRRMEDG